MKGLWRHPKTSKPYYRSRRGGKVSLVPLPENLPLDHPDFLAAFAAAAKNHKAPVAHLAGTIGSTWAAILASDLFSAKAATYRAMLTRESGAIIARGGHVKASAVNPTAVRSDVSSAPNPETRHKAWRFWASFCLEHGWITADPAREVRKPARVKSDGHPIWTHDQIATFRAAYAIGSVPRAIFELTYWTGARISDACAIGPQHIGRDGVLSYRQIKTGDEAYIPWDCRLPRFASQSDLDMCKAAVGEIRGLTFLQTQSGRPRSHKAAGHTLAQAATDIGIDRSAHGLRKARAAVLAESGATELEIGSWTGHRSLSEIVHYTREMNRRSAVQGTHAEREVETHPIKVETRAFK